MFGQAEAATTGPISGASGRQYNTDSLDLSKWGRKRKRLEAKVEVLQQKVQEKRRKIDYVPVASVMSLKREIAEMQAAILKLLAEIDMLRKEQDEAQEFAEVAAIYIAYRNLH